MKTVPIVDSHLDLADNAIGLGRDLTLTAAEIRALEKRTRRQAMVSLPELQRGGIAIVFATVTEGLMGRKSRRAPHQAEAHALAHIDLYETWHGRGLVRLIKSIADLEHHLQLWQSDRKPGLVMLMEGASPILDVRDLPKWWARGVRIIGLTWSDTRYGTGVGGGDSRARQGGLTSEGLALLSSMAELGFIWDISHLAEQGVWEGLDLGFPRVCASHANARALTPTNRHLSDEVIRAVADRSGVIGVVMCNAFLDIRFDKDHSIPVTLERVRIHAQHIASIAGWDHVGIGSDLDGGFGLEESPAELDSVADLPSIASVLPDEVRKAVLGGNWLRFLCQTLPS